MKSFFLLFKLKYILESNYLHFNGMRINYQSYLKNGKGMFGYLVLLALSISSCSNNYNDIFEFYPQYISTDFSYPVGKLKGIKEFYNAQGFGVNNHLGDDWNGVGGGDTDLGEAIFSISNGYVSKAYDAGPGWGNIVRIVHKVSLEDSTYFVESLYAHLDEILVKEEEFVSLGQQIGTMGNANGAYLTHLHFEIRNKVDLTLGDGYSSEFEGYLNPTTFIMQFKN